MILTSLRIALLYAAGLGAAGQFAKISVVFPAFAAAYPDAGTWLGFIVSALSLVGAVFGLVAGMAVARLGCTRILLAGLVAGAGLSALQAILPPLPVLLALRVIEGASHLAIVVAAPTLMAQVAPDRLRPAVMALWSTFFGTGFALFAWASSGLGASGPILLHAGLMGLVALGLWSVLGRDTLERAAPGPGLLRQHVQVYADPALSAPALGWLFYTLTFLAALTLLPRFADVSWLAGVLPLLGIALSLTLVAALLRRVPAVRVVIAGFALSVPVAAGLALQPGSAVLWIGLFSILALVQAGSFAAIPQLCATAQTRALANGALAQMGNVGNLIGTPLLLGVLMVGGTAAGGLALAACFAVGALLHILLAARRAST